MEELVKAGADVNAASQTGITALTAACRRNESLEAVLWLLEKGADPNRLPKDLNGPLLRAVRLRNEVMVKALLDHGVDPDAVDKKGESARTIARKKKAGAILDLLGGG